MEALCMYDKQCGGLAVRPHLDSKFKFSMVLIPYYSIWAHEFPLRFPYYRSGHLQPNTSEPRLHYNNAHPPFPKCGANSGKNDWESNNLVVKLTAQASWQRRSIRNCSSRVRHSLDAVDMNCCWFQTRMKHLYSVPVVS